MFDFFENGGYDYEQEALESAKRDFNELENDFSLSDESDIELDDFVEIY